jgi:NADH:ubiquinone oxidoreductase subunit K
MIALSSFLIVAAILFTIGVLGIFLNRRNVIIMLMAIELILLVAMIGAIVLTHRRRRDNRRQNASRQIRRNPKRAVKNLQPASGEGVEL